MQRHSRALWLAEAGVSLAMAWVLGTYGKVWEMPFGGSISLEMIPLFFFAYRWGGSSGIILGVAYGFLNYISAPWFVHWAQVFLDYPLPFALLGVAGYLRRMPAWVGLSVGTAGRFLAHFLSGVVFWASSAPQGMNPIYYSLVYNAFYLVPELIITIAFFYLMMPYAKRAGLIKA